MSKIIDILNSFYNEKDENFEEEPLRFNVYDKKGNLIGQDYQRDNGQWMHKWIGKDGKFERGSSKGRCKSDDGDSKTWTYKRVYI